MSFFQFDAKIMNNPHILSILGLLFFSLPRVEHRKDCAKTDSLYRMMEWGLKGWFPYQIEGNHPFTLGIILFKVMFFALLLQQKTRDKKQKVQPSKTKKT